MDNALVMTGVGRQSRVNGLTLKLIALITMFIDHFSAVLLQTHYIEAMVNAPNEAAQEAWQAAHPLWIYIPFALRMVGRFAFPIFAFLMVEGFVHTRSRKKYAINLAVFALISEIPFDLGFSGKFFNPGYQSVYMTLLFGLLCLCVIEEFGFNRQWSAKLSVLTYPVSMILGGVIGAILFNYDNGQTINSILNLPIYAFIIAGAVIAFIIVLIASLKWDANKKNQFVVTAASLVAFGCVAELLKTDYAIVGIATMVVMYINRAKKTKSFALGCLTLSLFTFLEAPAFLMLVPISKYNGERGPKLNKYFFYAFYPVHLGLLYLVARLIGITHFTM